MKDKIVHKAQELFYREGYTKVTTQQIVSELKMSKKTLYVHFNSKYELLIHVVDRYKQHISSELEKIFKNEELAYPELLRQYLTIVGKALSQINPVFIQDIQESEPEVWKSLRTYRREAAYIRFRRLIERGVDEGYVTEELNKGVLITLFASAIYSMMDYEVVSQLPEKIKRDISPKPEETFEEIIKILFKGILTEKGREELIKHKTD